LILFGNQSDKGGNVFLSELRGGGRGRRDKIAKIPGKARMTVPGSESLVKGEWASKITQFAKGRELTGPKKRALRGGASKKVLGNQTSNEKKG